MSEMKRSLVALFAGAILLSGVADAANIIWLERIDEVGRNEQAWLQLLTGAGHTVVNWPGGVNTSADPDYRDIITNNLIPELEAADLVIIGRHANSGFYNNTPEEIAAWNALRVPVLSLSPFHLRQNRWVWFNSNTLGALQVSCQATIPSHPIFSGVTLGANNRFVVSPETNTDYNAFSPGNGQMIAEVIDAGGTPTGFGYAVYWDGTQPYFAGGVTPGAPRFAFWAGGGVAGTAAQVDGIMDLTADGQTMFLNIIDFLVPPAGEGEGEGETCITATPNSTWVDLPIPTETGTFTAEYDLSATPELLNTLAGFSNGPVTAFGNYAMVTRFDPADGIIDVYKGDGTGGGGYNQDVSVPYVTGTSYHFRVVANVPAKTYTVYVTPQGGTETLIATDFGFRNQATQINNFAAWSDVARGNTLTACLLTGGTGGEGEGEPQGDVIVSNVYPPFIDEGTVVILTAPAGSGWQWKKDGADISGATDRDLVFDPVKVSDAGSYTVTYDDGTKVVKTTPPFQLLVNPEGTVPVGGTLAIAALLGACALGGASALRKR